MHWQDQEIAHPRRVNHDSLAGKVGKSSLGYWKIRIVLSHYNFARPAGEICYIERDQQNLAQLSRSQRTHRLLHPLHHCHRSGHSRRTAALSNALTRSLGQANAHRQQLGPQDGSM